MVRQVVSSAGGQSADEQVWGPEAAGWVGSVVVLHF